MARKKALILTLELDPAEAARAVGLSSAMPDEIGSALERLFSTETGALILVSKAELGNRSSWFERLKKRISRWEENFEKEESDD